MQASISFDTLDYMEELKKSGFNILQAEAITRATSKAISQSFEGHSIATKNDISELKDLIYSTSIKTITTISVVQGMIVGLLGFIKYLS